MRVPAWLAWFAWFDRPVRWVARTPRELVIIGVATATAVNSLRRSGTADVGDALAFAAVAVGFATRFFAARVIATAVAVVAAGLHVVYAWRDGWDPRHLLAVAYFLFAVLVLGARDLVARFDDAPRRGNFWREVGAGDRRRLAVLVHGVALTLGMLYYVRFQLVAWHEAVPWWIDVALVGGAAVGVLLLAGRAVAALIATIGGAALVAALAVHLPAAWSQIVGDGVPAATAVTRIAPHLLVGASVAGTLTVLAAAPWAWRLVRAARR